MRVVRRENDREGGYILAMTGLLVVVLFLFASFSVDVGGWYARASQLQRTADAAALAGVVWMPDLAKAQQVAAEAAAKNDFTNGVNDVTVSTASVPGNTHQLQVTITDASAAQFFSQLVMNRQSITRAATAEYILPVPLGSPKNTFGTGNLVFGGTTEKYWAAVSGYCSGRENGDLHLAHDDRTYVGGQLTCPGQATNPNYDATGYRYVVDLAQAPGQSVTIEIYDPSYDNGGTSVADNSLKSGSAVNTTYEVWDDKQTPLDGADNVKLFSTVVNSGVTTYRNAWMPLYTIAAPKAGQYFLDVFTQAGQANSFGSNGFGIRARAGSTFSVCSTVSTDVGYSASCPQVHGVEDMSIFANQTGSTATFYLAQIDPIHAGKTMEINLFDPGEGASAIEILNPNGAAQSFTWSTPCNPPTAAVPCSGSGTSLNVSGTGTQPYTSLSSTSKYNDRTVSLNVTLPDNYATAYGGKVWWKIRYTTGSGTVTDRTTWSVNVIGDPVHLVK